DQPRVLHRTWTQSGSCSRGKAADAQSDVAAEPTRGTDGDSVADVQALINGLGCRRNRQAEVSFWIYLERCGRRACADSIRGRNGQRVNTRHSGAGGSDTESG